MTGAEKKEPGQPMGGPDIYARLAKLRDNAKRGLSTFALPITIPLTLFIGGMLLFLPLVFFPDEFEPTSAFLVLFALALGVTVPVGVLTHKGILLILTSRFKTHYFQTTWYLYKTDFAVLVANEQFWSRIIEETRDMPILKWTGSPPPGSFEDCLVFAACYRKAICQCLSGRHLFPSSPKNPSGIAVSSLRSGSCLYYLGTSHAMALNWVGSLLVIFGCANCGFIFLPALFTSASRDAERRGSLAAICDFFLGNCEVDINQLPPPPRMAPMPPLPSNLPHHSYVARTFQPTTPNHLDKDPKNPGR